MFKKTLLAVALTGVAGIANAGTLAAPDAAYALEGSVAAATITPANSGALTTGTAYVANDVVSFTYTGATVDATSVPVATNATTALNSLSFIDIVNGNTVRFRVDANGVDSGDVINLTGIVFNSTGVTDASSIAVSAVAISTNPVIGNYDASSSAKLITFGNQFDVAVTAFDESLALDKSRKEFVGGLNDTLALAFTDNGGVNAITETTVTHTITGQNLSYLMDYDLVANGGDGSGTLSAGELATAITVTDGADTTVLAVDAGLTTITATQTLNVAGTIVDPSFQFNVIGETAGGSVLAAQSFTVESVATQTTTNASAGSKSAGAWALGADTTRVAFMPFASAFSQSVTVSNRFTADGEISIDWYVNGSVVTTPLTTVASARAITDISSELRSVAAANGITGNAAFDIIVNVPAGNADIVALYYARADQDRAIIKSE